MLITDQFIYIHQPKTGGTFVTDTLFTLYRASWGLGQLARCRIAGKNVYTHPRYGRLVHHKEKPLPLVDILTRMYSPGRHAGTVRNPFDWLLSQFEFGW